LSATIAVAIGEITKHDGTTGPTPLYDIVDPDALDDLFRPGGRFPRDEGTLEYHQRHHPRGLVSPSRRDRGEVRAGGLGGIVVDVPCPNSSRPSRPYPPVLILSAVTGWFTSRTPFIELITMSANLHHRTPGRPSVKRRGFRCARHRGDNTGAASLPPDRGFTARYGRTDYFPAQVVVLLNTLYVLWVSAVAVYSQ
jgi:hypothetical protein